MVNGVRIVSKVVIRGDCLVALSMPVTSLIRVRIIKKVIRKFTADQTAVSMIDIIIPVVMDPALPIVFRISRMITSRSIPAIGEKSIIPNFKKENLLK